jgi:hypothetical protein
MGRLPGPYRNGWGDWPGLIAMDGVTGWGDLIGLLVMGESRWLLRWLRLITMAGAMDMDWDGSWGNNIYCWDGLLDGCC